MFSMRIHLDFRDVDDWCLEHKIFKTISEAKKFIKDYNHPEIDFLYVSITDAMFDECGQGILIYEEEYDYKQPQEKETWVNNWRIAVKEVIEGNLQLLL